MGDWEIGRLKNLSSDKRLTGVLFKTQMKHYKLTILNLQSAITQSLNHSITQSLNHSIFCVSVAIFCLSAQAQSGRVKPKNSNDKKTDSSSNQQANKQTTNDTRPKIAPTPTPMPSPSPQQKTGNNVDVGDDDIVRVDSNLVTIPASIVDGQGTPITNLKLEDFELFIDGQTKIISSISRSETPVKLALLFDNSSSIDAAREFEKQAALKFFKRVIRPIDQAALYSVTDKIILMQALTSDTRLLTHAIESFGKAEGATSLIEAVAEAARYLKPFGERKVIVIVSDGEDTTSDLPFEDMLRIVQNAGCQVYVVNTKQFEYLAQSGKVNGNANIRALTAERRMMELTEQTGGAVYSPLNTRDVDNAFTQIAAELSQQYVLSYYAVDDERDGKFRTITLRTPQRKDLRIRARKGYYSRKP